MTVATIDLRDYAGPVWRYANEEHWRKVLAELRTAAFQRGIVFVDERDLGDPDQVVERTDIRWANIADAVALARQKFMRPESNARRLERWLEAAREDGYPNALLNEALNALSILNIVPINYGTDKGEIQHFPCTDQTVEVMTMEQLAQQ